MNMKETFWTLLLVLFTLNLASCSNSDKEEELEVPELTERNSIQFTVTLDRWRDMEVFAKGSFGIDWGDGTFDKKTNLTAASVKHRYEEFGEYEIKIWCEKLTTFRYIFSDEKATASNIKVGNCPELKELRLKNIVNTDVLDLRACHKLDTLTAENFKDLTAVDLTNCTGLEKIYCSSNPLLTSLDVSKSEDLELLECYENALTTLSLKNNKELLTLNAANNQLKSIDFGSIKTLTEIDVQGNELSKIDLTNFEELTTFDGSDNKFTSLDFSENVNITHALCAKNELTELIVNEESPIHKLTCNGNQLSAAALNELFETLPVSPVTASRSTAPTTPNSIAFFNNEGEYDCNVTIIKNKGWKVELKK